MSKLGFRICGFPEAGKPVFPGFGFPESCNPFPELRNGVNLRPLAQTVQKLWGKVHLQCFFNLQKLKLEEIAYFQHPLDIPKYGGNSKNVENSETTNKLLEKR